MTRLFLDNNVLMDLFDPDRTFHLDSRELIVSGHAREVDLVISSISVLNTIYSVTKWGYSRSKLLKEIQSFLAFVEVAPVTRSELLAGLTSGWKDVEDAIQFHSALSAGRIDAIVSNDKDFKQQKLVPVLTPAQALKKVKE